MKKLILILALALLLCSCVDGATKIGLDRLNWSQSVDGIIFSGTAPGTTTNALYSDSGTLKFNGSSVAGDNGKSPYDIVFNQSSNETWIAYDSVGAVIDNDADIGSLWNAVIPQYKSGNNVRASIAIQSYQGAISYTNETLWVYPFMQITGLNRPKIATWDDISIFHGNLSDYYNQEILITGLELGYYGTANYTHSHIYLGNPLSCWIEKNYCHYKNVAGMSYSSSNRGGIWLVGNMTYSWMNYIEKNDIVHLRLTNTTDNFIIGNGIDSQKLNSMAIYMSGTVNNNKIMQNHIVANKNAALYLAAGATAYFVQFSNNYIEPYGATHVAGSTEYGVNTVANAIGWTISENMFVGLGAIAWHCEGGAVGSKFVNNVVYNGNQENNAIYSDVRLAEVNAGDCEGNIISGNNFINTVTTVKAAAIQEAGGPETPNYNRLGGNTIIGSGYVDDVVKIGAQSTEADNIYRAS